MHIDRSHILNFLMVCRGLLWAFTFPKINISHWIASETFHLVVGNYKSHILNHSNFFLLTWRCRRYGSQNEVSHSPKAVI